MTEATECKIYHSATNKYQSIGAERAKKSDEQSGAVSGSRKKTSGVEREIAERAESATHGR